MAVNKYCVVNQDNENIIENMIMVEDSEVSAIEQELGKTLILDDDTEFSNIGCQYVNGVFQPVDPTEFGYEGWTKDENGVWDKAKTIPAPRTYFWNTGTNDWMLLSDSGAKDALAAMGVNIDEM